MVDFSQITERMFVGGQINDGDWPALKAAGITHVLDAQLVALQALGYTK